MPTVSDLHRDDRGPLRLVQAADGDAPAELARALGLGGPRPVVVLAGGDAGIDAALQPRLLQLLGRGLLRALADAGAAAVVRGAGGLSDLLGRALEQAAAVPPLVGVAPGGAVQLPGAPGPAPGMREPVAAGLGQLVLTGGAEWGAALRSKLELAQALADGQPVSMLVIGGGAGAAPEVLQAVRRGWPVLVVAGTGGAADALARQVAAQAADGDDPGIAEVLADGRVTCITLADKVAETVEALARQILRASGGESVLRQAWRRFAAIDAAAIRQQSEFFRVQWWILTLGVVAVALAITQTLLKDRIESALPLLGTALHWVLVVLPILVSTLIAATNRFKPGKRWVLLRSAAESIKREIYRYRLRTSGYRDDDLREKNLAKAVEDITRRLARTEANTTALAPYAGPLPPKDAASANDDGTSPLGTDQYVRLRLADQLAFYRRKTVRLEADLRNLQLWVLGAGAVGTLLAALGDPWVLGIALTTSISGAVATYLSYRQTETTLTGYNQTATDLENIQAWWTSLTSEEQANRDNIEALATHTEQVLADELAGWTQRMTDALEKLRADQTRDKEPGAPAPPPPPPAAPAPPAD